MSVIEDASNESRSTFGKVMRGIGRFFWFLRETVFNIVFLLLAAIILIAIFSGPEAEPVPDNAVLVLNPSGNLVEQRIPTDPVLDLLMGDAIPIETSINDILRTLEYAATDDRIQMILLDFSRLFQVDYAELERLQQALLDFQASGKQVWSHATSYSQGTYLLSMVADRVLMDPMGDLIFSGVSVSNTYYKNLLDKLKINVDVYAEGDYKTAVEPYTRTNMSEAAEEVNSQLVETLWARVSEQVTNNRSIEDSRFLNYATDLHTLVESNSADFSALAVRFGFIDALVAKPEIKDEYKEAFGDSADSIGFYEYLPHVSEETRFGLPKIAVIFVQGDILGLESTLYGASSSWVKQIERVTKNSNYEALVLRVNSPGGSVIESEEIRRALVKYKQTDRPLVASFGGTAASGGYWISLPADHIFATPVTVTGSIGVFGLYPNVGEALDEIGVGSQTIRTTPYGLASSLTASPTDEIHSLRSALVRRYYDQFIDLVAYGRSKSKQHVKDIAEGRIWLGEDALEIGLVDELGDFDIAVAKAAELADLDEYEIDYIHREAGLLAPLEDLTKAVRAEVVSTLIPLEELSIQVSQDLNYVRDPSNVYARCVDCAFRVW